MQKITAIIVMLLAAALIVPACQKKQEKTTEARYPAGPLQTAPMQPLDEIGILRDAVKKDPGNVRAWIKLGNDFMDSARYDGAIEAYKKALALDPKDVDVRVDMGTCYRRIGKPKVAVMEFRKAIEINPNHIMAHRNLAVVLAFDMKDGKGAIKEFRKALSLDPNAADAGKIRMEIERLKAEGNK